MWGRSKRGAGSADAASGLLECTQKELCFGVGAWPDVIARDCIEHSALSFSQLHCCQSSEMCNHEPEVLPTAVPHYPQCGLSEMVMLMHR